MGTFDSYNIEEQMRLLIQDELTKIFSDDEENYETIIKDKVDKMIRTEFLRLLGSNNDCAYDSENLELKGCIIDIIKDAILYEDVFLNEVIKDMISKEFDVLLEDKETRQKIISKIQKIKNRSEILDLEE